MKNKVLLSGATGFIGQAILKELLAKDFIVTALSNKQNNQDCINLDLLNKKKCEDFFAGKHFDFIIHTAAIAHNIHDKNIKKNIVSYNTMMTENILNNLDLTNTKVIFLSSVAVYSFKKGKPKVIFEDETPNPISDYGISKLMSEEFIKTKNVSSYNIYRLPPVFSDENLYDIKKRIVLPLLNKPFITKQKRCYSFVHINTVVKEVIDNLNNYNNYIKILKDDKDYDQKEIISWFDFQNNSTISINNNIISPIIFMLSLIPFKRIRILSELVKKLFYSNIYQNVQNN